MCNYLLIFKCKAKDFSWIKSPDFEVPISQSFMTHIYYASSLMSNFVYFKVKWEF